MVLPGPWNSRKTVGSCLDSNRGQLAQGIISQVGLASVEEPKVRDPLAVSRHIIPRQSSLKDRLLDCLVPLIHIIVLVELLEGDVVVNQEVCKA